MKDMHLIQDHQVPTYLMIAFNTLERIKKKVYTNFYEWTDSDLELTLMYIQPKHIQTDVFLPRAIIFFLSFLKQIINIYSADETLLMHW